jgi:hypothetical protein
MVFAGKAPPVWASALEHIICHHHSITMERTRQIAGMVPNQGFRQCTHLIPLPDDRLSQLLVCGILLGQKAPHVQRRPER